jgi:pimeloyl-ACP methyl ester carboxylesterase
MNIGKDTTQAHRDSNYVAYLTNVAYFGFVEKAYSDTTKIRRQLATNDSIIRSYGWSGYNDTVLAYMMHTCSFQLNSIKPFIDTLRKYSQIPNQVPMRPLKRQIYDPFGITENEWWRADTAHTGYAEAYAYQSKRELGFFDIRFDEIASTPQEAEVFNQFWIDKAGCMRDFISPHYASLSFNRALYDRIMDATKNATKPIILIYGNNDPWAQAAVKDEYLSPSVKKYILPNQHHLVFFQSNTDPAQCDAIRQALDAVLKDSETDIEHTAISPVFNGKTYNLLGQEVDETYRGIVIRDGKKYIQ